MGVYRLNRSVLGLARLLTAGALLAALVPAVEARLAPPRAALAANFVVNLTTDPGDGTCDATCTLRDAILNAGTLPGQDTITFSPAVTAPIVLASALPLIGEALTIDGSGQAITIDGASLYRPLLATAPLTLTALTIQRGKGANDGFGGGGAYFGSTGAISSVNFISNTSPAVAFGAGGAYFAGSATVQGGSFISNTATAAAGSGGGAYFAGAAIISGTVFMTNTANGHGGGLIATGAATITNASFISNTAIGDGGGAYVFGAAVVTGSTFTRNVAAGVYNSSGGGASLLGVASLAHTTFMSNTSVLDGGGVKFWGAAAVSDSTFIGNSANYGGGTYLAAGGGLTSTTFMSNTALGDGGGLYLADFTSLNGTGGDIAPISGATFTSNTAMGGGGDIAPISGVTFTGNQAMGGGGGALLAGPSAISGSTFRGNTAATSGGAVYFPVMSHGEIITGTLFASNGAGSGGGGGARFSGPATVSGTTFSGNSALGNGGGARFDTAVQIAATSFTTNTTYGNSAHGGGAYFGGPGEITATTFVSNTAHNGNGGGWYGTAITVTDTTVTGNQALCADEQLARPASVDGPPADCGNGGGEYGTTWAPIRDIRFRTNYSGNTAERNGGGLYTRGIADNGLSFSGVVFEDNTAGERGGGAYLESIAGDWGRIEFGDNQAGDDAGGLFLDQSQLELANAIFFGNLAVNADGAADLSMSFDGSSFDAKHVTFAARFTGFQLAVSVGTDLPDEKGQQDTVASLTNVIFHGYDIGVQGQAPTSTVTMTGVLWSSVNTKWQVGNFSLHFEYTGEAAFVNEAGGDYHLSDDSDAIDRGVPTLLTTDLDGQPRSQGLAPDLGAYEAFRDPYTGKLYLPLVSKRP